jgi:DNA-binding response OmpR family regulator
MKSALIVIEDPAIRLILLRVLGRHGWWVDAVDNLEWALAFLDGPPRDVVLVDWDIGRGSGLALLWALKMHPAWK